MDLEEIKKELKTRYYGCKLTMGEFFALSQQGFEFQPQFIYHKEAPGLVFMYKSLGQGFARDIIQPTMSDEMEFLNTELADIEDEKLIKILKIMDRATMKARIDKDDYRIASSLDFFSLDEINSLLKYSIKNGKKNCTAVLLNYKNDNYSNSWTH